MNRVGGRLRQNIPRNRGYQSEIGCSAYQRWRMKRINIAGPKKAGLRCGLCQAAKSGQSLTSGPGTWGWGGWALQTGSFVESDHARPGPLQVYPSSPRESIYPSSASTMPRTSRLHSLSVYSPSVASLLRRPVTTARCTPMPCGASLSAVRS